MGDLLQPTHLLFVLVVALLVLGPKRLPEVGRALGRGLRDFRSAMSGEEHEHTIPPTTDGNTTPAPTAEPESPTADVQAPVSGTTPATSPSDPADEPSEPVEAFSSSTRGDSTS